MQISATMDVTRLNNAIDIAHNKASIGFLQLTEAAGLFFSQSFAKALRKSRVNRPIFSIDRPRNKRGGQVRTTHILSVVRKGRFFRRSKQDLQAYKKIEYQGMARALAIRAAVDAGFSLSSSERMGDAAKRDAGKYASGLFVRNENKPHVTFVYQSDDIAGWMGDRAAKKAIRMTSRRILGWAGRVQKEIRWGIEGKK